MSTQSIERIVTTAAHCGSNLFLHGRILASKSEVYYVEKQDGGSIIKYKFVDMPDVVAFPFGPMPSGPTEMPAVSGLEHIMSGSYYIGFKIVANGNCQYVTWYAVGSGISEIAKLNF